MGGISDFLFGSKDKLKKVDTGTPQQNQFHASILSELQKMLQPNSGFSMAQDYYKNLLQPGNEAFDRFSQPYLTEFNEQILPQIAERFAGAGALSSSGFGQALGGAASNLQSQLAQLFSSLQNQAAGAQTSQFNQMSGQGLGYQPFAYVNKPGSSGLLGSLAAGLGGPLGNSLASGIGSLFKPKQSNISGDLASNSALLAALFS